MTNAICKENWGWNNLIFKTIQFQFLTAAADKFISKENRTPFLGQVVNEIRAHCAQDFVCVLFKLVISSLWLSLPCLSLQTPEELEDDSDFEQEDYDVRSRTSVQTEDDQLIAGQSARVSVNPPCLQWVSHQ